MDCNSKEVLKQGTLTTIGVRRMQYKVHKQYEIEDTIKTIVVPTRDMYIELLKMTPILLEQKTAQQVSMLYYLILQGISDVDTEMLDRYISGLMCDKDKEVFIEMLEEVNNIMTTILTIQLSMTLKKDRKEIEQEIKKVVSSEKN